MNIMDFLKVLKQPKVFLTSAVNIFGLGLNFCGITEENYMKIVWIIVFLGVQFGIMSRPNNPFIETKISEMENMEDMD